jgi:hypothetical protein
MNDVVYRLRIGRALGRSEGLFSDATRLADELPFFELRRPHGFEQLERTADLILGAIGAAV